jgi:apolipoprotein D and lipocalin family protein
LERAVPAHREWLPAVVALLVLAGFQGCQMVKRQHSLPAVAHVDLNRFMGDWYVIANIPTRIERGAHNAVENYRLAPDGRILTTFTFRKDAYDGPLRKYEPVGYVRDTGSNAVWGMQFVWPIKADYRIVFLDPEYGVTVVAREARDYVWIMARTPEVEPERYRELVAVVERLGYDMSKLQRVPQKW